MEIFHGFHDDGACRCVHGVPILQQHPAKEGEEKHEEEQSGGDKLSAGAQPDGGMVHVVDDVERSEHARQEQHRHSETEVPGIEQGVETRRPIGPPTDDGRGELREVRLRHDEVAAVEERGHGTAQQRWSHNTVEHEEAAEGAGAQQVALLQLELIAHGLQHKREQDDHPQPVGTAEAGAVEQRERGEESAAEGDERGERDLPLAARRLEHQALLILRLSQAEHQRVGALHEEQEHEQRPEQRHDEPPILL